MAQKKMTLADIRASIHELFSGKKIADPTWSPSKEEITGLMDKIAKSIYIDGLFNDKLPELDAENIEYGEAIEEFYQGLVPAMDFNDNESNASSAEDALKPYRPTFDQVCYSERLPRKKFKTTVDYNKFVEACQNAATAEELTNLVIKRLYDSFAAWRYEMKRNTLGTFAAKAVTANAGTTYTKNSTVIKAGVIYKESTKFYIAKKNFSAAVNKDLSDLAGNDANYPYTVSEVTPSVVQELAAPTDESSSEALITAIKMAVEDADDISEGTSLAGSTIGAQNGLVLYVKKGIMPVVEVQALAGAIQVEKLSIPATVKVIKDFGPDAPAGLWGLLVDPRGVKVHNNYRAVRLDENGDGDYVNYTLHNQDTAFVSNHTFVKAFIAPAS